MSDLIYNKNGWVDEEATINDGAEDLIAFKRKAEQSVFFFAKYVLGYSLLTEKLHGEVCSFIQGIPPNRKLLLLPRNHYKSTISRAFAIHLLIQPDGQNVYFPYGIPGRDHSDGRSTRILLASKTADLARDNLGEIALILQNNQLLHTFWPQCVWEDPQKAVRERKCKAWNNETIQVPRDDILREGTIETIGVGGTRTGYHFDVNIHDDLIDIKDRNSQTTMATAIEWHSASRAFLQDEDQSLELILGTHWAVNDLYTHIKDSDPTVECYIRAIIENGEPILPESYSIAQIERMKRPQPEGYGNLFPLLYMNNTHDPELVDFDVSAIRYFSLTGDGIEFNEDESDSILRGDYKYDPESFMEDIQYQGHHPNHQGRGQRLSQFMLKEMLDESNTRDEFLRMRYS